MHCHNNEVYGDVKNNHQQRNEQTLFRNSRSNNPFMRRASQNSAELFPPEISKLKVNHSQEVHREMDYNRATLLQSLPDDVWAEVLHKWCEVEWVGIAHNADPAVGVFHNDVRGVQRLLCLPEIRHAYSPAMLQLQVDCQTILNQYTAQPPLVWTAARLWSFQFLLNSIRLEAGAHFGAQERKTTLQLFRKLEAFFWHQVAEELDEASTWDSNNSKDWVLDNYLRPRSKWYRLALAAHNSIGLWVHAHGLLSQGDVNGRTNKVICAYRGVLKLAWLRYKMFLEGGRVGSIEDDANFAPLLAFGVRDGKAVSLQDSSSESFVGAVHTWKHCYGLNYDLSEAYQQFLGQTVLSCGSAKLNPTLEVNYCALFALKSVLYSLLVSASPDRLTFQMRADVFDQALSLQLSLLHCMESYSAYGISVKGMVENCCAGRRLFRQKFEDEFLTRAAAKMLQREKKNYEMELAEKARRAQYPSASNVLSYGLEKEKVRLPDVPVATPQTFADDNQWKEIIVANAGHMKELKKLLKKVTKPTA